MTEWISVKDRLPEDSQLVLVETIWDTEICFGKLDVGDENNWSVQPFLGVWYKTREGVKSWIDVL